MLFSLALPPLLTWPSFVTFVLLILSTALAFRAAVRRPVERAASHWSRCDAKSSAAAAGRTYRLEHNWEFTSSKNTSNMGPLSGSCLGRQTWSPVPLTNGIDADVKLFCGKSNVNAGDRVYRTAALKAVGWTQPESSTPRSVPASPATALADAISFYTKLQTSDGHWAGDYGGPMFLLPGLIIACHVTGVDLGPERRSAMTTYLLNHQQIDGGWGLHIESPSTMFGTALSYVSLRLLGMSPEAGPAVCARQWMCAHGGAVGVPSWGKFWLAAAGLYSWEGLNPLTPELWLLPYWFPLHPARMWCHCRMVYLPMCYMYGRRSSPPVTPLTLALRSELFDRPYESIDWNKARFQVCPEDLYSPHTWLADRVFDLLRLYEAVAPAWLRKKARATVMSLIHAEDEQTNYVDIGPVNKVLNMMCVWYEGDKSPATPAFLAHTARIEDYLWVAEDGMKMQGYNGSQLWDTSFATQAFIESGLFTLPHVHASITKAYAFIQGSQIDEDVPNRALFYRHISKGGWPFSTKDHGWPISDCTAEGLKAALAVKKHHALVPASGGIPDDRLFDAVTVILSFQNPDGGWATYELNRGWNWFEWFNPSEVFGDIMIDYTYLECTSACVTALAAFAEQFPDHRSKEVAGAIASGGRFIRSYQRADGAFFGKWAVCFTYGAWFGVEGLLAAGEPLDSPRLAASHSFLLSHQSADGGWGESPLSCLRQQYIPAGSSNPVNTSWALLSLMRGRCGDTKAVQRGVEYLTRMQLESGDWEQGPIAGVFNRTTGITYTSYRNVFPIWALGVYTQHYAPSHGISIQ